MNENTQPALGESETVPGARSASRGWIIPAVVAGAIGIVLGVGGTLGVQAATSSIGNAVAAGQKDTRLHDAPRECMAVTGITEGDDGKSLTIDAKGKEDLSGTPWDKQQCILEFLKAPSSVMSHIGQTTAMDGRQTESWDGITVEWSYHPDRGADMVIKLDKPKA